MNNDLLQKEIGCILELLNINYKEISFSHDNDLHLDIFSIRLGKDREIFLAENNHILKSLSVIVRGILERKFHYFKDFILDINQEQKRFIEFTKEKASLALERVLFFNKSYEFGPLNSYERMIIHTFLKNKEGVSTESQGEGLERRLIVKKI
jgi:spoIIIJ-associated protein